MADADQLVVVLGGLAEGLLEGAVVHAAKRRRGARVERREELLRALLAALEALAREFVADRCEDDAELGRLLRREIDRGVGHHRDPAHGVPPVAAAVGGEAHVARRGRRGLWLYSPQAVR